MTRVRVTLTTRGALLAVVLGMGVVFLWTVRGVLIPFVWALVVAYILNPLVRWLTRRLPLSRFVAVVLLFLALLGSVMWTGVFLQPVLAREGRELATALPRIAAEVQDFIFGRERIEIMGLVIDLADLKTELTQSIQEATSDLGRYAVPFLMRAVNTLVHAALFFIATFYLLLDLDKIGLAAVNFLPRRWRRAVIPLLTDMERVLGAYIRGQVLLIFVMSTASWIALTILGIRYSLLLAIVTGVLEIFPVIGPWTAGGIAVSVSLTQPTALFGGNSVILAAVVATTYFTLRQLEDILVIPNLIGRVMELHPLLVLVALTTGGYLGGLLGVLIAVPITAVAKLYLRFLHEKFMEEEQVFAGRREKASAKVEKPAP